MKYQLALLLIIVSGCVHEVAPGQFAADTNRINHAVGTLQDLNAASAPVNPYAGLIAPILAGLGGAATGISILIARIKTKDASKANAAAGTLAKVTVDGGGNDTAILASKMDGTLEAVSTHLAEAKAANGLKSTSQVH